ncbi:MAG: hypothetical protein PHF74_02750 [Dehalococcoidales bacterium]|nr:hypothetical protein [Dehalococcoidales bacterium]
MGRIDKTEKEFTKDLDRLLSGKKIEDDRQISEDYRSNIETAGRIIECRREPSDSYKKDLKIRLLLKLREKETAAASTRKPSFWDNLLSNLSPRQTAWRLVPAQVALAVISLLAIWGIELVSRPEPVVTWPPGGYSMLELLFFSLGILNNLFLIFIFLIRKNRLTLLKKIGWIYFLLALPAIYGIVLTAQAHQTIQYTIFLGIFLLFMLVEWLYDYVLKIDFRGNWKKNWKLLVPYLALYYAVNYGFIVMNWKVSMLWGIIMLVLFAIQLVTNLISHSKNGKQSIMQ